MITAVTSQKVAIPAAIFLALSPGMFIRTNGSKISYNMGTDNTTVFFLAYSIVAKTIGLAITKRDLIVTTTLFIALSPGFLLTIPPGNIMSGDTSRPAILTHTVVFAVVFALLRKKFPNLW